MSNFRAEFGPPGGGLCRLMTTCILECQEASKTSRKSWYVLILNDARSSIKFDNSCTFANCYGSTIHWFGWSQGDIKPRLSPKCHRHSYLFILCMTSIASTLRPIKNFTHTCIFIFQLLSQFTLLDNNLPGLGRLNI